jgi:hypothetical protein
MKLVRLVLSLFSFTAKPGQFTFMGLLHAAIGKKLGKWKLLAQLLAPLLSWLGRAGVGRGLVAKYWPKLWRSAGRKQLFRVLRPDHWLRLLHRYGFLGKRVR